MDGVIDVDSHEDTREIELDLKTDINVCAIDGRTPPQGESTIGNLVQTGTLGVGKLLVPHRLFEAGRLLPEETLPGGEVGALEQRMLEDTFDTSQGRDDIDTVVVQLPELSVVSLRSPPERIAKEQL